MTTKPARITPVALAVLALSLPFFSCQVQDGAQRIAFVYGISIYDPTSAENSGVNLSLCDDDAIGMAELLLSSGYTVYARITGSNGATPDTPPTRAQIVSDIASIPAGTDRAVFYFSGHGWRDSLADEDYIIPYGTYDAEAPPNGEWNRSEFIGATEWRELMAACPAPQKICIFDSCYSGGFVITEGGLDLCPPIYGPGDEYGQVPSPTLLDPSLISPILARFMAGRGDPSEALVLSAAGSMELSWERGGHGIFTGALLETVLPYEGSSGSRARADSDGDGIISAVEAYAYAALKVQYGWNQADGQNYFDAGQVADFHPHLSSGPLDSILFSY